MIELQFWLHEYKAPFLISDSKFALKSESVSAIPVFSARSRNGAVWF